MKKKIGAFGAGQFSLGTLAGGRPRTTIFQRPGGGGGGWGVSHTRTGPGRPSVVQGLGQTGGQRLPCGRPLSLSRGLFAATREGVKEGWGGGVAPRPHALPHPHPPPHPRPHPVAPPPPPLVPKLPPM